MVLFEFDFKDTSFNFKGKQIQLKSKNFDIILSVIANNIINKGVDKNGYTIISSNHFRKEYFRFNIYLEYLIERKIIERDYYKPGCKSYGFRFTEMYKQKMIITRIIYYPSKNKYVKEKAKNQDEIFNIDPLILRRLKKDYNNCTINFDLGHNQLEKTYDEWNNFIDIGKWFRNNLNLYKWQKGHKTFCFKSNRLYTNFTSLSSHIRKNNIKLNKNEKLFELDIPNSFPKMLSIHLINENPDIINDSDFKEYCSSVISGTFYNSLTKGLNEIRNCNKKGNEDDYSTRLLNKSEVKQIFQVYLNGNNKRQAYINGMRPLINEYMSLKYPCIHEQILELKMNGKDNVYDKLVQIETKFIFGLIAELYERIEGIRILTIHDAINISEKYKNRVQVIWDERMKELVKDLPYENNEDDLDLGDCSISIFEEEDDNLVYKKMKNEKDISFFEEEDDDDYL